MFVEPCRSLHSHRHLFHFTYDFFFTLFLQEMHAPDLPSPARYTVALYESVGSSDDDSAFETLQAEAVHATSKLIA
jgi:hypothetical protein